ncbi:MAG: porphobilinogen synthase [Coriobacteriales bacterium]|jgi:porphobilinogen synthase|nr:porphobilinogen synthase [Coriobacteriales bacterium]
MEIRSRRLRSSQLLRKMTRETRLSADSLIYPFFVREGQGVIEELPSLPGQVRYSPDTLSKGVEEALENGVSNFILFGLPGPEKKDAMGTGAWIEDGVVQQALQELRRSFGDQIYLLTDVCLCEYTDHGHCGLIEDGKVQNDSTLPLIAKTALSHAQAGCDMVAPSGMMDRTVAALREALDAGGYPDIPIMSYAAKYASAYYGPFRDAAGSTPQFGDRKTYQMDYHNQKEALKRIQLDVNEGADLLIVKPAIAYLDIIAKAAERFELPIAAYQVSGEYAIIKAAAAAGLIDERAVVNESAVAIYRAGAEILISYFAKELAQAIQKGDIG